MIIGSVMTDHPSWLVADDDSTYRAVRSGDAVWALTITRTCGRLAARAHQVTGRGHEPLLDIVDPEDLTGPKPMLSRLRELGPVARWRNPDLWDALATSIVRQVIRAGQARKLYRAFCRAHGEAIDTALGTTWLFPSPTMVRHLPDSEFAKLGLAFKSRPLRAAAEAYLEFGTKWTELDASALFVELQTVPRIGPWTAGATVADLTNDYALYPYADLAVRTWTKHLAPRRTWPDTEPEFADAWARLAGDRLSEWTLLTLAWGVHHASTTGAAAP
jgi:DNA-3-methyladenine glycosylase II